MSSKQRTILCSIGTRPELIKMAPVIKALKANENFNVKVLFTAQHRDMLDQMATYFGIHADLDLDMMRDNQQLADLTAEMLKAVNQVLELEKPDFVLAQGDTTTVMVTALACFYQRIPFGHVEAGLRTYDKWNPYPEEINRKLVGSLTDLHFCPTEDDKEALLRENVNADQIFVTGNTVIDAVVASAAEEGALPFNLEATDKLILVTIHRRESFGEGLRQMFEAVLQIAQKNPDHKIIYPVHPNPNVKALAHKTLGSESNVMLTTPVNYGEFVALMKHARLILTDSGGIQEEAPSLNVPVLILRETTERPQAVTCGAAKLVGVNTENIVKEAQNILTDPQAYEKMQSAENPFGDGRAALRIAEIIVRYFS